MVCGNRAVSSKYVIYLAFFSNWMFPGPPCLLFITLNIKLYRETKINHDTNFEIGNLNKLFQFLEPIAKN